MEQNPFSYSYSAQESQEVLSIRKKYLPREETKLEELRRLDRQVQRSGVASALILGIVSCLVFGVGMCFGLGVFGKVTWPGILPGVIGTAGMLLAYPLYQRIYKKNRQLYTPRILELSAELCDEAQG